MLSKVKEYILKVYTDNQKENGYWMGNLMEYFYTGMDRTVGYEDFVKNVKAKDIKKMAAAFLKSGNKATVIMTVPEEDLKAK